MSYISGKIFMYVPKCKGKLYTQTFGVQNLDIPPAPSNSVLSQLLLLYLFHSIN